MQLLRKFLHELFVQYPTELADVGQLKNMSSAHEMYLYVHGRLKAQIASNKEMASVEGGKVPESAIMKLEMLQFLSKLFKRVVESGEPIEIVRFPSLRNKNKFERSVEINKVIKVVNSWNL